jgi:hypothetical protein
MNFCRFSDSSSCIRFGFLDLKFIYVLPEWEGSASDSRVLRAALRRNNRFIIPSGNLLSQILY